MLLCAWIFEKAEKFHKDVYSLTKNELELLVADIGLMKIYQRTAMNKEFYDYRNSALRRMKRIDEDNKLFVDKHERLRLNYARSNFISFPQFITTICNNVRKRWLPSTKYIRRKNL